MERVTVGTGVPFDTDPTQGTSASSGAHDGQCCYPERDAQATSSRRSRAPAGNTALTGRTVADRAAHLHNRVLDIAHLTKQTLGQTALQLEVLELFRHHAARQIQAMQEADAIGEWRFATHTLKGAARGVGAFAIADLAEQAERLDPFGERSARDEVMSKLDKSFVETMARINAFCDATTRSHLAG